MTPAKTKEWKFLGLGKGAWAGMLSAFGVIATGLIGWGASTAAQAARFNTLEDRAGRLESVASDVEGRLRLIEASAANIEGMVKTILAITVASKAPTGIGPR